MLSVKAKNFMLHLRVITPKRIVLEQDVDSLTIPTAEGEITVLPQHTHLFSMLKEGIITIRSKKDEDYLAIGAGYMETDGKDINLLVSRAYGQDEIDDKITAEAIKTAQTALSRASDHKERMDATMLLRRSTIDDKLLKLKKRRM